MKQIILTLLLVTLSGCKLIDSVAKGNLYPAPDNASTEELGLYIGEGDNLIVFLHGNGMDVKSVEDSGLTELLRKYGTVAVPEYPGYGPVEGEPNQQSIVDRVDMTLQALKLTLPNHKVIIMGWSLGAAVAAQVADKADVLILVSPWTSFKDAAMEHPFKLLLRFVSKSFFQENEWDTLSKVSQVKVKATVIHGVNDNLIPVEQGKLVAEALGVEPILIEGAGHNDIFLHVWDYLDSFLN